MRSPNHVILCGWMLTELNLSGDKLFVYAYLYDCYRFLQNKYLLFSETVEFIADWFKYDKEEVEKIIGELEKMGLIELDFDQEKKYAKMKIHEPEYN